MLACASANGLLDVVLIMPVSSPQSFHHLRSRSRINGSSSKSTDAPERSIEQKHWTKQRRK